MRRETRFPSDVDEMILSGPHFYVANPCNKTPREVCTLNSHYDVLDLETLPDDYLPRTNYVPACERAEYQLRKPTVPWGDHQPVTEYFRIVFRRQLSQSGERTLIPAIAPNNACHIHPVISWTFKSEVTMVVLAGFYSSISADFMIKTTGKGDLYESVLRQFPVPVEICQKTFVRALALNCLTTHYSDLWSACWDDTFQKQRWFGEDPRLNLDFWANLTPYWQRTCALRTDFSRRWALAELDVLAARALGLTLDELQTIYRIQFPVLRQNEADTWYDQAGRIVFTCSKGLPGVGFSRPEWEQIKGKKSGTVERTITDNTLPGGPRQRTIVYEAPFDRCNREQDYETVWREIEKRMK